MTLISHYRPKICVDIVFATFWATFWVTTFRWVTYKKN